MDEVCQDGAGQVYQTILVCSQVARCLDTSEEVTSQGDHIGCMIELSLSVLVLMVKLVEFGLVGLQKKDLFLVPHFATTLKPPMSLLTSLAVSSFTSLHQELPTT